MAANSIGSASLLLSTSADKLTSGLNAITGKVSNWASGVSESIKSKLSGINIGGMLSAKLPAGLGSLKGGIAGLAAGFGLEAITGSIEKIKELGDVGKTAKSLGIASDQYMGLAANMKKVGVEGDAVKETFGHLAKATSDAALGQGKALKTLEHLGLDAKQLASMPIDQQFISIAEAISKLPPGAQQSGAAFHLFGGQAMTLLPILQQGRKGLEDFIAKAKESGQALSQVDMNKIMEAQKAIPKMKAAWEGLSNKILVAVAPVLTMVMNKIQQVVNFVSPAFKVVGDAISAYWEIISEVISVVWNSIRGVIKSIADMVKGVFGFSVEVQSTRDMVITAFKWVGTAGAYCWDTLAAGVGLVSIGVGLLVKGLGHVIDGFSAVVDLLKELPDDMRPQWMDNFVNGVDRAAKSVKGAGQGMMDWGTKQVDGFGDSAKKVDAFFENIRKKRKDDTSEMIEQAKQVQQALQPTFAGIKAVMKGSAEAYEIQAKWKFDGQQAKDQLQKDALNEQKKANQKLDDIRNKLGAGKILQAG